MYNPYNQYNNIPQNNYTYQNVPNYYNYNYRQQAAMQPQFNQPITPPQTNTNKIFVSGIDEVKRKELMPNSDMLFLDNDKPILYQKVVDSKGQFEVKEFEIVSKDSDVPKEAKEEYVSKNEFSTLLSSIEELKGDVAKLVERNFQRQNRNNSNQQKPTVEVVEE